MENVLVEPLKEVIEIAALAQNFVKIRTFQKELIKEFCERNTETINLSWTDNGKKYKMVVSTRYFYSYADYLIHNRFFVVVYKGGVIVSRHARNEAIQKLFIHLLPFLIKVEGLDLTEIQDVLAWIKTRTVDVPPRPIYTGVTMQELAAATATATAMAGKTKSLEMVIFNEKKEKKEQK